jgi:DNA-binding winged helix-turn-helix (wHTH) protein
VDVGVHIVPVSDDIALGELEIRRHERTLLVHGEPVAVTSGEFDIILTLAEHPGWVYSAGQLASDPQDGHSPESVSVLISRLRHCLAEAGLPDAIETVRGFGYRLHAPAGTPGTPATGDEAARRELRDATWRLQEAVIEAEHSGTAEQQSAVAEALEKARHAVYAALAK